MLRNSLINLSPFPFKECSERIIDFYFLVLSTFSEEKFWPPLHSAIMLDRVLPGGDWGLVKQRSKLLNYEIEFSDAFQTKIGSCPVRAAMTAFILQKTGKREPIKFDGLLQKAILFSIRNAIIRRKKVCFLTTPLRKCWKIYKKKFRIIVL